MSARTSLTHPLQIDALPLSGGGRLGFTFCPGKKQQLAMTGAWERDLALDLQAVKAWNAQGVTTLLEPAELIALGVPELGNEIKRMGMNWTHVYLPNDAVPDTSFMRGWAAARGAIHQRLNKGESEIIHCMGGIGRTVMVGAMLLVERGMKPEQAIADISAVREGAFCVPEQVEFIRHYRPQALFKAAGPTAP